MPRYQMSYLDWAGETKSVSVTIEQAEPFADGSPSYCAVALGSLGYGKRADNEWAAMQLLALNHGKQFLTASALYD